MQVFGDGSRMTRKLLILVFIVGMVGGVSATDTVLDDWNDGDSSEWATHSGSGGNLQATTSPTYEGSHAAQVTGVSGSGQRYRRDITSFSGSDGYVEYYMRGDDSGWSSGSLDVRLIDDNDDNKALVAGAQLQDDGDLRIMAGNHDTISNSFPRNEWIKVVFKNIDTSSETFDYEVYDSNGNLLGSNTGKSFGSGLTDGSIDGLWTSNTMSDGSDGYWDYAVGWDYPNSPSSFDSVSTEPGSWTKGSDVNVSYDVSDDSQVSSVCADVYENGTQIVSNQCKTYSSTPVNDTFTDLFKVDKENVYYNYTLTATDNDGATTTYSDSQLIQNLAPKFNLLKPVNNSDQFSYSKDYELQITDDGDNVPEEEISCTLFNNTKSFRTVSAYENDTQTDRTFTGQLLADAGSNTFTAECVDGDIENKTNYYTTNYSEIQNLYGDSQVYETKNESFELDLKTGSMVNEVDFDLFYNGSIVEEETLSSNGIETLQSRLRHEIPLVDSNQTQKDWRIQYSLNTTDFQNSNNSIIQRNSSVQNQDVLWSYYLKDNYTNPKNGNYIEGGTLQHLTEIHTETKKAQITGQTTYNRTGETEEANIKENNSDNEVWKGEIGVGRADSFNRSVFGAESTFTINFKGDSRDINTKVSDINVHRIRLSPNSGETNVAESLVFHSTYEGSGGRDINTDLYIDLTVSKNGIDRKYNYIKEGNSHHRFYIRPSWAKYEIETKDDDLIQYEKSDGLGVLRSYFFPIPETISNQTTTVPLLTINKSETDRIQFEVTDSSGAPAGGVICRVDRKFPGLGKYQTVFMIKTGSEGNTESFAEVNEIYYRFTCYEDGEVIDKLSDQIMQDPMRIRLGAEDRETVLDYAEYFDASCINNLTHLECDYQSQSDNLVEAELKVERREIAKNIQVCQQTGTTRTGVLICSGLNTSNATYDYTLTGKYPEGNAPGTSGVLGIDTDPDYGPMGIILTILIYAFILIGAAKHLLIGIGAGTAWLLVASLLKFFPLTPEMRATLIAFLIVIGAVINK